MQLFDEQLGELEVSVVVDVLYGIDSYIHAGYCVKDFRELTDEELDILNETHRDEIQIYASMRTAQIESEANRTPDRKELN